jgi:Ethylbenzene dehydrogenase
MKKQKHTLIFLSIFLGIGIFFQYCKKDDQNLNSSVTTVAPVGASGTQLTAVYTATAFDMTSDWTVSSAWASANAPLLQCTPVVPNPGQGLFTGYIGKAYNVQMQAMYDSTYIYFLVQLDDMKKSVATPWYFDTVSKNWKKEASSPTYDVNGVMTRSAFQEDKFGVLWNINNSCEAFKTQTCYGSCHVFTPYYNRAGQPKANASGNHYTTYANEKIDMWHMRLVKDPAYGVGSDEYQDYVGGPNNWDTVGGSGNGRHVDGVVPTGVGAAYTTALAAQGAIASQTLTCTDNPTKKLIVPTWYVLDPSTYKGGQYYIDVADTGTSSPGTGSNGVVYIVSVTSTGTMSFATTKAGTPGAADTINPNTPDFWPGVMSSTNYYNVETTPTEGKYCQPASFATPLLAGRGDIDVKTSWNGSKCIIQIRRKLTTGDMLKQDIDFKGYHPAGDPLPTTPSSSGIWFQDQPFGIAFFNNANNQHAIKPNLLLHFKTK